MKFVATRFETDGEYIALFEKENWDEAKDFCDLRGWRLDGEFVVNTPFEKITMSDISDFLQVVDIKERVLH